MQTFDLHTHSIASGHGSRDTIADMAKEAASRGITLLGISDHGPDTLGSAKISYFNSLKYAPKLRADVRILYGVEANIIDYSGTLDVDSGTLKSLDYCIASMHVKTLKPSSMADNTSALLGAMENPFVRILGHIDDGNYPIDYEAVIKKALEKGIIPELNNTSLCKYSYRPNARENSICMLKLCMKYGCRIVVTSDSHGKNKIGVFDDAFALLAEVSFPDSLILKESELFIHP